MYSKSHREELEPRRHNRLTEKGGGTERRVTMAGSRALATRPAGKGAVGNKKARIHGPARRGFGENANKAAYMTSQGEGISDALPLFVPA